MSSTGESESNKSTDASGSGSSSSDKYSPSTSGHETASSSYNSEDDCSSAAERRTKFLNSENALALAVVVKKDKTRKIPSPSLTLERRCSPRFSTGKPSSPLKKKVKLKSIAQRPSSVRAKGPDKANERKGKEVFTTAPKKPGATKVQKIYKGKDVIVIDERRPRVAGRVAKQNIGKSVAVHRPSVSSSKSEQLKLLHSRTCPAPFMSCITLLSEFQKDLIKDWGFGFLLSCDLTKFPWRLSYFVVDKFDWISCSIKISSLEDIRLTDSSVERYIGLPKGSVKVDDSKFKADPVVVLAWKSQFMVEKDGVLVVKTKITPSDVCAAMIACDESKKDMFIINLLVLVNSLLVESCQNGDVNTKFLRFLGDLNVAKKFNWCEYTIRALVQAKKNQKDPHYFKGPILLLLLAYVDRLVVLGVPEPRRSPCIIYWTSEKLKDREEQDVGLGGFGLGYVRGEPTDIPMSTDDQSKEDTTDKQLPVHEDGISSFDTLQKYIARLANLGSQIGEHVREFLKLVSEAPKELVDNVTFIKINEACEKLLNVKFLSELQRQSQSLTQDSQDRFFSDIAVIKCIEEIERAVMMKNKFEEGNDKCTQVHISSPRVDRSSPQLQKASHTPRVRTHKVDLPSFSLGLSSPDIDDEIEVHRSSPRVDRSSPQLQKASHTPRVRTHKVDLPSFSLGLSSPDIDDEIEVHRSSPQVDRSSPQLQKPSHTSRVHTAKDDVPSFSLGFSSPDDVDVLGIAEQYTTGFCANEDRDKEMELNDGDGIESLVISDCEFVVDHDDKVNDNLQTTLEVEDVVLAPNAPLEIGNEFEGGYPISDLNNDSNKIFEDSAAVNDISDPSIHSTGIYEAGGESNSVYEFAKDTIEAMDLELTSTTVVEEHVSHIPSDTTADLTCSLVEQSDVVVADHGVDVQTGKSACDTEGEVIEAMNIEVSATTLVEDPTIHVESDSVLNPTSSLIKQPVEFVLLSSVSNDDVLSAKLEIESQSEKVVDCTSEGSDSMRKIEESPLEVKVEKVSQEVKETKCYQRKNKSVSFTTPVDTRPKRVLKLANVKKSPFKVRAINVMRHVTEEEIRFYSWIMGDAEDKKECVFKLNSFIGLREDFQLFKPKTYLSQHMIEIWANLLNLAEVERSADSPLRFFGSPNALLFTVTHAQMNLKDRSNYFNTMFMDFLKLIPDLNINQVELFVFPVYFEDHFFMISYNIKNPRIDIIDNSDADWPQLHKYRDVPENLTELFCELLKQNGMETKAAPFVQFKKAKPERLGIPWMGENKVDCGIFLMRHMETYMGSGLQGWNCLLKDGDKEQMARLRTRYMSVILSSNHNLLVKDVKKAISSFPAEKMFKRRKLDKVDV